MYVHVVEFCIIFSPSLLGGRVHLELLPLKFRVGQNFTYNDSK